MTNNSLADLSISDAAAGLRAGDFSASDLVAACRVRAEAENGRLNAYLELFDDAAAIAAQVDAKIRSGELTAPLAGIPLAVKDNILIAGQVASAASRLLEGYRAAYDATVIRKLRAAGAIFLGRTNMDEFAMGGSTENSAFGPTRNPHDDTCVAGGSSGGSAAAVAARLALGALGSDTGGSIRQPASFCGVVGLKPTYGAVSRSGLMAMASSLDQIGPFGRTVADAEIIFEAIRGGDPDDATSQDHELSAVPADRPLRIGVPRAFLEQGVAPEVLENFNTTLEGLAAAGVTVETVALPALDYALAAYYIIVPAEISANMARYDGVRYGLHEAGTNLFEDYARTRRAGLGAEVRRRILLGTYVLSAGYYDAYYHKATQVRTLIRDNFTEAFRRVDALALPTVPHPAWKLGEKTADPLTMYLEDIFTVPVNLAGLPGLSVPSGQTAAGLPLGFQLVAPRWGEPTLFALGKLVEQIRKP